MNKREFKPIRRIDTKIKEATRILEQLGYESEKISAKEFYDYMTGETPTGDVVMLNDVLLNEFFMVHEIVEISELKKMDVPIDQQTIMVFYPEVYVVHLTALDYELTHALNKRNYAWFQRRLSGVTLEDPYLPQEFNYLRQELAPRCKSIIKKFSEHLPQC
ncbi:MAG: hypothetical protein ACETVQ_01215 [Candidatus Bathyarchaeia archaeon]